MSDQGGGDRPRWEGFPGGVDPDEGSDRPAPAWPPADQLPEDPGYPDPAFPAYQSARPADPEPVPPRFPVEPSIDQTAPIPVVPAFDPPLSAYDPEPELAVAGGGGGGDGLGPRSAARAKGGPRQDTSRVVALACAVAVVLVGSGFAFVACNDDAVDPADNAPVVALTSIAGTPTPSAVPSRTPSRAPSNTPSATASATTSPSASASATVKPVKQPVTVLNSTGIQGLAARVAQDIKAGGWTVTETTNWRGAQPAVSTIYYLPGDENKASAKLFAQKFGVAKDVKKALPGMTSNLTLVLTRDAS